MPPKFKQLNDYSFGFYSPGICPTGWGKGCDFDNAKARTDDGGWVYFGGDVLAGETVRICCPSGYSCLENDPYSSSKCTRVTESSTETAFALQVRWQESDLSILATDPTVPGSTYTAPSTATASQSTAKNTAVDTPTPSSSSNSSIAQNEDPGSSTDSGIPTGTIIGIVIGVGGMVAAFAVAAVIFFIWRHRRKRREESGTRVESMISGVGDAKPSPAKSDGFAPENKAELDSRARASTLALSEAPADRDAIEMPPLHIAATEMEVPHFVAELPGSMPAGHDDGGEHTPERDVPRSPLPTAETSQRESGALGQMGHWKKRSVARSQSRLHVSPISRSSTSASATTVSTDTTTEDRRQNQT